VLGPLAVTCPHVVLKTGSWTHHEWWLILQALFMIASVLPVTSTTAVRTINKGVLIPTSLLRGPETPDRALSYLK
jgi:hypothetical protein